MSLLPLPLIEEGVCLARFDLGALSQGLTQFLMTFEWKHYLLDLSLVLSVSSFFKLPCHNTFPFASSPLCSCWFCLPHVTLLSKTFYVSQSGVTDCLKWTKAQHLLLCLSYKLHPPQNTTSSVVFIVLFLSLCLALCSCAVHSLSAFSLCKSQHHTAKALWDHTSLTIFIRASEADSGNRLSVLYTSLSFSHPWVAR